MATAKCAMTLSRRVKLLGAILVVGGAAPAERSEIRVAEQYGLSFLPLKILAMLDDPRIVFTLTPHRVLRTAEFMHRIGRVKHRPTSWKDLFFANVHSREGGS